MKNETFEDEAPSAAAAVATEVAEPGNLGEALANNGNGEAIDHEQEGYNAFQDETDIDDNPHEEGSEAYAAWRNGWERADAEANPA